MTIYEIKKEFFEIEEMQNAINEETGEFLYSDEEIRLKLNILEDTKTEKANNICHLINNYKRDISSLDYEIKRLQALKKSKVSSEERLLDLLDFLLDGKSLETDLYKMAYRKSESVIVNDISSLQHDYIRVETKTSPDKAKIKKALKDGIIEANDNVYIEIKNNLKVG